MSKLYGNFILWMTKPFYVTACLTELMHFIYGKFVHILPTLHESTNEISYELLDKCKFIRCRLIMKRGEGNGVFGRM